jgi:hypothetical protein
VNEIILEYGECMSYFVAIKEVIHTPFESSYMEEEEAKSNVWATMLKNISSLVSVELNLELTKEIDEEEITRAIWGIDPDKSPGSNGFSIHFFNEILLVYNQIISKVDARPFMEE